MVVAGCYSPEVEDCAFTCTDTGMSTDCPEGAACIGGYCRPPDHGSAACGGVQACGWGYTPTNFDPCSSFVMAGGINWPVLQNLTYNTDQPPPATTPDVVDEDRGGAPVRLIRINELMVGPSITLEFVGSRAVILIADRVSIGGTIIARSGTPAADCELFPGISGSQCGGGGAGGAFAGGGGAGAGCADTSVTPTAPTTAATNITLEPPRTGCPGGRGGRSGGGLGGANGGALQISVKVELNVSGATAAIIANGRGGAGGSVNDTYGGGGGGAGGGILLEGPKLRFAARICAEGGGGGEGTNSSGAAGVSGTDGCASTPPKGGVTATAPEGAGGDGGYGGMLDGLMGIYAISGGGGGGGGAGVIRLHSPDVDGPGAVFSPAATIIP